MQQDALGNVNRVKENPAGCAGKRKQSKGNIGEEKSTVDSEIIEFCDEISIKSSEGQGMGGRKGVAAGREACGSSKFLNP